MGASARFQGFLPPEEGGARAREGWVEAMSSRAILLASRVALLIVAALAFTCGQDTMEDPTFKVHTLMEWVRSSEGANQRPRTGRGAAPVLYIDASASMRGFADGDGQFEYSRALRAVADTAEKLDGAQPLRVRRIDNPVHDLPDAAQALIAARAAGFYTGASSNIAATIRSFATAAPSPPNRPGQVDVFVTDGVQSLPHNSGDPRCAGGADPRCVNAAIGSLIDRGWGAHLFGIRSRFSGPVFSELHGGGKVGAYQAVNPAEPSRFRPFLLFVFTERREQLEGLVDRLREALVAAGVDADLIRELPLTLPLVEAAKLRLDTAPYAVRDALGGASKSNPLSLAAGDDWRVDSDRQPLRGDVQVLSYAWHDVDFLDPCAVRITADLTLTAAGRAMFGSAGSEAAAALQRFTVQEIARPQAWYRSPQNLAWPPAGYQLKHLQFDAGLADAVSEPLTWSGADGKNGGTAGGGHLVLKWSQAGDYLPITLVRVESRLEPAAMRLPPWTAAWSTNDDSSPASANRLLNLEPLVHGLLRNPHLAPQGLAPWFLVIWPKKA
jgi:hypothetical protein